MPYSVNYTVKGKTPVLVNDKTLNLDTSLVLPGRGKTGFGEALNETLVHLLENFSSPDAFDILEANVSGNYIDLDIESIDAFQSGETYTIFNSSGNDGSYLIDSVNRTFGSPDVIRVTFDSSTPLSSNTTNDGIFGNQEQPLQNLVTGNYSRGQIWHNERNDLFYYYTGSIWKTLVNANSLTAAVEEAIEDIVGNMVDGGTESGINVTYSDNGSGDGKLNFNVDDFDINIDGAVTGSGTVTNLGDVTITTAITHHHDSLYVNVSGDTMTGNLNMDGNVIQNVANPVAGTDAMSRNYADNRYVNSTGDTMTGNLNMNGNIITQVGNPSNGDDAMSRNYADNRYVNSTGDTMTGNLDMGNNFISGIANPTSGSHAMDRAYADNRYVNVTGDTMTGTLTIGSNGDFNVPTGGAVIGSPTGGNQGDGTVNAEEYYVNGSPLSSALGDTYFKGYTFSHQTPGNYTYTSSTSDIYDAAVVGYLIIGGGGGGGGDSSPGAGGGGAGAWAMGFVQKTPQTNVSLTVGSGGNGAPGSNGDASTHGQDSSVSTDLATRTAIGGNRGRGDPGGGGAITGGNGGTAINFLNAMLAQDGQDGQDGQGSGVGGDGGDTPYSYGTGGEGSGCSGAGCDGSGYGAGGGGGGTDADGGDGADGLVIIWV